MVEKAVCGSILPFDEVCLDAQLDDEADWRLRADAIIRIKAPEEIDKWLVKCIQCIDLTSLNATDTPSIIHDLVCRAKDPIGSVDITTLFGPVQCAAVCVYPSRIADVQGQFNTAAVAGGFPSGQYGLESRLAEIRYAIEEGANEIDVVIDRSLALQGRWEDVYGELKAMRLACAFPIRMKTILSVGELGSLRNVYKASMVAMMAGSDFIKTSTGKEATNANLESGLVMALAIRRFYAMTNKAFKVGLKPAGGIKRWPDAMAWMMLVHQELGDDWLNANTFRIGASSLLGDVVSNLRQLQAAKRE